jgi:AmmeMemoRadiSam system protein B
MVDARKPAAAGVFYPAGRDELARTVRGLLDRVARPAAPDARAPRAIVAPHAVYASAGSVAASAWGHVAPFASAIRRVVLLGPAHHLPFTGVAAPFADAFATPLGSLAVDRIAIETARRLPQLVVSDAPHEQEHSLEVQLPFVQTVLGATVIVPLVVGEASGEDAAEVLEALWDGTTLVVVSTDLSHYYDDATARRMDEATACAIEALEADAISEDQACGRAALQALLRVARARGMCASRLDVRNSGHASGELDEVVGFGAFAFA